MIALTFLSPAQPLLEPLGVCQIDDRGASCWSFDGKSDPELTAKVDRQARAAPVELAFVRGKKNRFLVARFDTVYSLSATSTTGPVVQFWLASELGSRLIALRVASRPEATTEIITAKALVAQGQPAQLAFREGSKAQVEDVALTLGPIERGASYPPFNPISNFGWRFAIDRTETAPPGDLAFEAIGVNGKPIRYVDSFGRPYDESKGEAIWRQIAEGKWDWRTPPEAGIAQFGHDFSQPMFWYSTNVDPKIVRRLQVRRLVEQTQTIGPFALDPT